MFESLIGRDIEWSKVDIFHLDEYIGVDESHPASFRRYLRERVFSRLPEVGGFYAIEGDCADLEAELARINEAISSRMIDVCFAGIGENGHLAFNDPPADFSATEPYIIVELDRACRQQQVSEGWFGSIDQVPARAISMSIAQIMKSHTLLLSIPGQRKAAAVQQTVEGQVSPLCPASIVQTHPRATLYLDKASAGCLKPS